MSDVRALLKAKRQEARIQHPYASYTSTGQLRCTACETVVKQASAWAGHVGSKGHRENVTKQRTRQAANQGEVARSTGKRKVGQEKTLEDEEFYSTSEPKKRKVTPDSPSEPTPEPSSAFPSNFFSDPSRAPIRSASDDSSDEGEHNNSIPILQEVADNPIDLEWQRFQQEMLNSGPKPDVQRHETFQRATIFAEPELLEEDMLGLPTREPLQAGVTVAETPKNEESRKRKEDEEKELIMDRLLDEERAQEEADAKVMLLKGRLEALKKKRNEAKAVRAKRPQ